MRIDILVAGQETVFVDEIDEWVHVGVHRLTTQQRRIQRRRAKSLADEKRKRDELANHKGKRREHERKQEEPRQIGSRSSDAHLSDLGSRLLVETERCDI